MDESRSFQLRIAGVIVSVVTAGALGLWLGDLSVRDDLPQPTTPGAPGEPGLPAEDDAPTVAADPLAPPLFFYAGGTNAEAWPVVEGEIKIAASAGHHQYVLPVKLPGPPEFDTAPIVDTLNRVILADPEATVLFDVDLNPSADWLAAHPEAVVTGNDGATQYVSPASVAWQEDVKEGIRRLIPAIMESPERRRLIGGILSALQDGHWIQPDNYDRSVVNEGGFRSWLQNIYQTPEALQTAWGDSTVNFDVVKIPQRPVTNDPNHVFLSLPAQQPVTDFLRYTSESIADTIAGFATLTREVSEGLAKVYTHYGYTYELVSNSAGHYALGILLQSDVDGFITPVSYVDRALGGTGGFMGPVDSAQYHGKRWFVIDDTRTGVSRDPISGEIGRLAGLRTQDVFNVQRRNFTAAAAHGLGLLWSDPLGEGWLHDAEQWEVLGNLHGVYTSIHPRKEPEGEEAQPVFAPTTFEPDLLVVVDESSRFVQQCESPLNENLLHGGREAAMRCGIATHFVLLQDVLEERSPSAPVYLFLNAFRLTAEQRQRLHQRFAQEAACAIWIYAPGYFDGNASSIENIASTVAMQVKAFTAPQLGGSMFRLSGGWMSENEEFGTPTEWGMLTYIEDPEADILATYQAGQKPSAAIRFLPEGWTSVFIAEPFLPPGLLREILRILEFPLLFRPTPRSQIDTIHITDTLIGIHGKQAGEAAIDLGQNMNIQDLFAPDIGWPNQNNVLLPLQTGETRLLRLSPISF